MPQFPGGAIVDGKRLDEEAIFHTARKILDPEARAEYLEQICGTDRKLRDRVENLLRVAEEDREFLRSASWAGDTTSDPPPAEPVGKTIGRYKLLQQIGQGGFGVVYMAEQERPMRRKVALKIISPGMDSREVIARFEAERQALSLMDHPNIAKVLDAGTTDSDRPYFVMELVHGKPITQYCDERQLTTRQRLELFLPVCHAIQHAHQKGIIHRDIKPSNILVAEYDERPVAKVIDFGVAKATSHPLTARTLFTGFGQVVGTLEYMSPEQAKVNQLDIDTRSDIYSLGVVLYELLVGELPFDRERFRSTAFDEVLRIIREEDPPRPSMRLSSSRLLPDTAKKRHTEPKKLSLLVRGELDWIVMKCLEKERSRRYETANGLAKDLERYLEDEPVQARPPTTRYRLEKFARRHKSLVTSSAVIFFALLLGFGVATWQAIEKAGALGEAEQERLNAEESEKAARVGALNALLAQQAADKATRASQEQLYRANMVRAWDAWKAGNLEEAKRLHGGYLPGPDEDDFRGVEWYLLADELEVTEVVEEITTSGLPVDLAASADGNLIAVSQMDGKVLLLDKRDGTSRTLSRAKTVMHVRHFVSFSSTGEMLVAGGEDLSTFRVEHVGTGKGRSFSTEGFVTSASFGPDAASDWIAVAHGPWNRYNRPPDGDRECRIAIWNWKLGKEVRFWRVNGDVVNRLAWSSDGRLLAAACYSGNVFVFNPNNGEDFQQISVGYPVFDVIFLENDTLLAATGQSHASHQIQLWSVDTGTLHSVLSGHDGLATGLARLPNGDLASCGRDNRIIIWDVSARREKRRLCGHSHFVNRVVAAGTPDAPLLVSSGHDFKVAVWDTASTDRIREIRGDGFVGVRHLVMAENEEIIVRTGVRSNEVEFRHRLSGNLLQTLHFSSGIVSIALSPGDRLVVGCVDGRVFLYEFASGAATELPRMDFLIRAMALSPDGEQLALAGRNDNLDGRSDDQVAILRLETQRIVKTFAQPEFIMESLTWSSNGKLLAAGGSPGIRVWWTDSWKEAYTADHGRMPIVDVSFSPDGTLLASCGYDGVINLLDAATGDRLGEPLTGHAGFVWRLAFSPDGKTLFTTCGDETLGVWDVASRELRARIPDHIGGSYALCVSRSGEWLLTGGLWDNKIHVRRLKLRPQESTARK